MSTSKIASLTIVLGFPLLGWAYGQDESERNERCALELDNLVSDDASSSTRDRAKRWFLEPVNRDLLIKSSDDLINALDDYSTSKLSREILGLLELPKVLKVAVLDSDRCPDKVKARLGDIEATDRIIARFNTADNPEHLRILSLRLLYAENPTTLAAFKSRLESGVIMLDVHQREVAVAMILLGPYGEFHTDQKLISYENLRLHSFVGKENFGNTFHQNYLRKVEVYFEGILGSRPTIDVPFLCEGEEYIEHFVRITTDP